MKSVTKKASKPVSTKESIKKKKVTKKKVAPKRQWVWTPSTTTTNPMFDVQVSLMDVEPQVWRRFLITRAATFAELHEAIQDACSWQRSHAWAFRDASEGDVAGIHTFEDMPDARKVKLEDHVPEKGEAYFTYEYDFGDGWQHGVVINRSGETGSFRKLLDGARSFPPEDCGGPPGYERYVDFMETGVDPWGEDARELKQWLGGWQPDAFKLEAARKKFDS